MYIKRNIENTILKISSEFPIIVLTGARQVGKFTVLQLIKANDMKYVTLDDLDVRNLALNDPKYFLEQYSYPLLIDEIQYAPNLLPFLKIIVDEERINNLRNNVPNKSMFWLICSQQFKVMKDVSESLAGRIGVLNLYSLSLSEILNNNASLFVPQIENLNKKNINVKSDAKQVFELIYNGGMPDILTNTIERNNYFSSYINTYIERNVKRLLNVGKTMEFYNFM